MSMLVASYASSKGDRVEVGRVLILYQTYIFSQLYSSVGAVLFTNLCCVLTDLHCFTISFGISVRDRNPEVVTEDR